jgi:hypothetical protein
MNGPVHNASDRFMVELFNDLFWRNFKVFRFSVPLKVKIFARDYILGPLGKLKVQENADRTKNSLTFANAQLWIAPSTGSAWSELTDSITVMAF